MVTVPLPLLPPEAACATCTSGCRCRDGAPGCGHYGCRGEGAWTCEEAGRRAAAYQRELAARRRQRAVLAARRTAWRTGLPVL